MSLTASESSELFRNEPDAFLDVGAGEVAYRRVGRGPDVLFVHGWPASGATFRKLLPYLSMSFTCHLIDLPGAGSSRFDRTTPLSIDQHIKTVRSVVDLLDLRDVAVVGHDSGGLIARHAFAADPRVRSWVLIDTEQPHGLSLRFRSFLAARHIPGIGGGLGWVSGRTRLRRTRLVFGDIFCDPSLIDGEFNEFFLEPLRTLSDRRAAAVKVLRSFDVQRVEELGGLHQQINVPVQLIWGDRDPFFPISWAKEMVGTFPVAKLSTIRDASLFCHEERPAEISEVMLSALA